jgi:Fic family protein
MQQWLKYFLVGVEETATEASNTLSRILQLKIDIETTIHDHFGRRAPSATLLLNHLFKEPVISVDDAAQVLKTTYRPTNQLIAALSQHQIVNEVTGLSRNRLFVFSPYLRIFDSKNSEPVR